MAGCFSMSYEATIKLKMLALYDTAHISVIEKGNYKVIWFRFTSRIINSPTFSKNDKISYKTNTL